MNAIVTPLRHRLMISLDESGSRVSLPMKRPPEQKNQMC